MKKKTTKLNLENNIRFTDRQILILQLWEECTTTEEIAFQLGVSTHTIITQLKRMRKKLSVHRTFEVYKYVKDKGML